MKEHLEALERMVDETCLSEVLELLAQICWEKDEHLRSAWQDNRQAREWSRAANMLDVAASRVNV